MTREMQHESEQSGSDSRPGFSSSSAMDENTVRRMELARVSDAFRNLETTKPRTLSAEQWKKFSDEVFERIEVQQGGFGARLKVLKDKISATDSRSMRALALVSIIAITLLAAALVWLAISLSLPRPAPETVIGAVTSLVEHLTA
jgi:hypothetical protein